MTKPPKRSRITERYTPPLTQIPDPSEQARQVGPNNTQYMTPAQIVEMRKLPTVTPDKEPKAEKIGIGTSFEMTSNIPDVGNTQVFTAEDVEAAKEATDTRSQEQKYIDQWVNWANSVDLNDDNNIQFLFNWLKNINDDPNAIESKIPGLNKAMYAILVACRKPAVNEKKIAATVGICANILLRSNEARLQKIRERNRNKIVQVQYMFDYIINGNINLSELTASDEQIIEAGIIAIRDSLNDIPFDQGVAIKRQLAKVKDKILELSRRDTNYKFTRTVLNLNKLILDLNV